MQTLTRTIELDCTRADGDAVPAVLSTEFPVDRGDYIEILEHTPQSVDLSRAPLPLIESHDSSRVNVGLVTDLTVAGGKLRGMVRFGKSARARELLEDVKAGIVRNLSIGYQIKAWREEGRKLIATSFQVLEASVVGVPADPAAGFYRSHSGVPNMTDTANVERDRVREILAIGRLHNLVDDAEKAISEGMPLEQFRQITLNKLGGNRPALTPDWTPREAKSYSVLRAIRAQMDPKTASRECGFELEVSRDLERAMGRPAQGIYIPLGLPSKRDLTTSVGSGTAKSGYLVPQETLPFIDVLRNAMILNQLGVTSLTGLQGNIVIPRKTSSATAYWVSENTAPTEGTMAFDQITMAPKTLAAYVDYGRRFAIQSSADAEALVRNDLAEQCARAFDAAAIGGAITNGPTGIRGTSGINSYAGGTNGAAPTWTTLVSLIKEVEIDNAAGASMAFLTNDKVKAKLMLTPRQSSGVEGNFVLGDTPERVAGHRVVYSNVVPSDLVKGGSGAVCSAIYFGDWSQLLWGMWGPALDVLVDPYSLSNQGATRVVIFSEVDFAVRHAAAFAICQDVLTS